MSEKRSLSIMDAFDRVKKRQCSTIASSDTINALVDFTTTTTNDSEPVCLEEITTSSELSTNVIEVVTTQSDVASQSNSAAIGVATDSNSIDDQMDIGLYIGTNICKTNASLAHSFLNQNWIPPRAFKFPSIKINGHARSVCVPSWLSSYPWLYYSVKLEGVVCRYCVLLGRTTSLHDHGQNALGQLVSKPLRSLKNASSYLQEHGRTQYHLDSSAQVDEFLTRYIDPSKDIDHLLLTANKTQQAENRKILINIVRCLIFLAEQNISFRGDDDDGIPEEDNRSQGNFRNLILFRIEAGDSVLDKHLENCAKNATYLSPKVQNELINLSATHLRTQLLRELIETNKFYSIIADETSDVSGMEQLSLVIRYVSDSPSTTIKEIFLGFAPLQDMTAQGIFNVLFSMIRSFGLKPELIRGQGYDGARTMSGQLGGLQKLVQDHVPRASYVHCSSHSLDLVIQHSCELRIIQSFFATVKCVVKFFSKSPKRKLFFKRAVEATNGDETRRRTLIKLCETRWVEKHLAISVFRQFFSSIVMALENLEVTADAETAATSRAYRKSILDIEFAAALIIVSRIFSLTKPYSEQLQDPKMDLFICYEKIEDLCTYLSEQLNSDDYCHKMYNEFLLFLDEHNISRERSRNQKAPRELFDLVFNTFLSNALNELSERFSKQQQIAAKLSRFLPSIVTTMDFDHVKETFVYYQDDLPNNDLIVHEGEFDLYKLHWKKSINITLPITIAETLSCLKSFRQLFANIYVLLEIFGALPVSVATAERSFSAMKQIKTFLRNRTGDERLSSLALLSIHKNVTGTLDPEKIVDEFAKKKRRIKLFD